MPEHANIVTLLAQAEKFNFLGEALRELVVLTREEPGCSACELHCSALDGGGGLWMVYERWRDEAAFESHMGKSYVKAFLARLDELIAAPVEIKKFDHLPL